ncbi:hypothetical protein V6N12_044171 [Hibiscus sabdariffa]|uniref:Uncharacterized protein n=1 Tax=Hibiscus sabdariffa TaxID=183260 RepID=A0ABR2DGL0_9ROSI
MGSLQSHEARTNRSTEKSEEHAFQVKETFTSQGNNECSTNNDRGRGRLRCGRGRGCGYGKGRVRGRNKGRRQFNEQAERDEENKLFMACIDANHMPSDLWFVDSGCSNI